MSEHAQIQPAQPAAGRARRRWLIGGAAAALLLAGALGVWRAWPARPPEPPLPDLAGADDEVVEAIQKARNEVLRQGSAAAWGRLGEVLLAHEFNAAANRCFQQAESLDPSAPTWPYLQGMNLVANDPEAGIACLERAVRNAGDRTPIPRCLLAETLMERDRLDEAQSLLERVLHTDPGNVRARLGLGRVALLRQDGRAALDHLEGCQEDAHARKRCATLRAEAWALLGEAQQARAEQRQAEALPPDQPWPDPFHEEVLSLRRGLRARFQTVDNLLKTGRTPDAVQQLQEILDRYPQSVEAWMRLGSVWAQVHRPDQAAACYQRAVALAPDMAEAWFRLGCMQYETHHGDAEESFRHALRLKPDHAQAHFNLGQCLKEQGHRDEAAAEFRAALRARPDYDRARTALQELDAPEGKPR